MCENLTMVVAGERGRTMVQVVLLSANGESRTLKTGAITGVPNGAGVAKAVRKVRPAELIGTYTWKDAKLQLWGWKEGKAGTENKHELPPPHDEGLYFSDIVVADGTGKDFTVEEWKTFYHEAFKGFEDLDDSASEADVNGDEETELEEEVEEDEEEEDDEDAEEDSEGEEEEEEDDEDAGDEEEEEDDADDDCYEDGDEAGGGKRRTARRRTGVAADYRRMEMGFRTRLKLPAPVGKRAPRWQTAPELTAEGY